MMKSWFMAMVMMVATSAWSDNIDITVDTKVIQFSVTLPANPSTGYSWVLTKWDKTLVKMTSQVYLAPELRLMGAGGDMQFNFIIVNNKNLPKSTQMTFQYQRPWEKNKGTDTVVTVHFGG